MLYREVGQYKTNYAADMAVFPILQDRIGISLKELKDINKRMNEGEASSRPVKPKITTGASTCARRRARRSA